MKPRIAIPLAIIATVALIANILYVQRARARALHEAMYHAVLDAWSSQIAIGMNRTQAEDVIHQKDIAFTRNDQQNSGLDDLIAIGHESPPILCRTDDIYVRVGFASSAQAASPSDKVQHVDLFEWTRNCL